MSFAARVCAHVCVKRKPFFEKIKNKLKREPLVLGSTMVLLLNHPGQRGFDSIQSNWTLKKPFGQETEKNVMEVRPVLKH